MTYKSEFFPTKISCCRLQISSDEEEDEEDGETASYDVSGRYDKSSPKGKRKREKSRSPTPPPSLSEHQIQSARQLVRYIYFTSNVPNVLTQRCSQALSTQTQTRARSPTYLRDEYDDDLSTPLNPELARIAAQVKKKGVPADKDQNQSSSGEPSIVTITIRWKKHPENPMESSWTQNFPVKRVCSSLEFLTFCFAKL